MPSCTGRTSPHAGSPEAGGISAVLKELLDAGMIQGQCKTVTGKTVAENVAHAVNRDPEVIRPIDNPYTKTGGLAVLFETLLRTARS